MGLYIEEGTEGNLVVLKDVVTGGVRRAISPAGYRGERGELWTHACYHWNDFVVEGYVNNRTEVIYLAGLPDVPASRLHSEVNEWGFGQ